MADGFFYVICDVFPFPASSPVVVGRGGPFRVPVFPENCPLVTGVAAKSLFDGATVQVFNLEQNATSGALLDTGTTAQDGSFYVALGSQPGRPAWSK